MDQPRSSSTRPGSSRPGEPLPDTSGQPRVLLVDDEEAILRAYARVLNSAGYAVETAGSGEDALAFLGRSAVDVIVTDLTMPGMSGMDCLQAVRQRDPDLPVIVMTGSPTTESAVRAMEYGALRYLLKPIARDALERALKDAVHLRRMALLKNQAQAMFGDYGKQLNQRADLSAALKRAVGGIFMAYQPIVRWSNQSLHGYEGLVRSSEAARTQVRNVGYVAKPTTNVTT